MRARTEPRTGSTSGEDDDDDALQPQPQLDAEGDHPGHSDATERDGRSKHALREDAPGGHVHLVHRRAHGRSGQTVDLPGVGVPHGSHIVEALCVNTRQHHRQTADGHIESLYTLFCVFSTKQLAVCVHI